MAFWSSQRLKEKLTSIVDKPDLAAVDCNAITLRIGGEIYITPGLENSAPNLHTKKALTADEAFTIPPGQFAFLLTQEKVTIPQDAMGFISFKARYKMKGLVNVSGFHVDPGFSGPLIFAVFNAGPATVHLQQGWPLFLLWLADLDSPSVERKTVPAKDGIPPDVINSITGVVDSIYELEKRIEHDLEKLVEEDKSLSNRIHDMEKKQQKVLIWLGVVGLVVGMLAGGIIRNLVLPYDKQVAAAISFSDRLQPDKPGGTALPTNTQAPADKSSVKSVRSQATLQGGKQTDGGATKQVPAH